MKITKLIALLAIATFVLSLGGCNTLKGVGRIYQQTFVDTYSKVAFTKLYTTKVPITAADLLNDRVLPFYEAQDVPLLRILTDRGTEYCGNREQHEYELYLALENIDHTKTKARRPQTNGICERFHRTMQEECYALLFRKNLYQSLEQLQHDVDTWLVTYKTIGSLGQARRAPLVDEEVQRVLPIGEFPRHLS